MLLLLTTVVELLVAVLLPPLVKVLLSIVTILNTEDGGIAAEKTVDFIQLCCSCGCSNAEELVIVGVR